MPSKFQNLNTDKGIGELDKYLAERSYIEGYTPSAADAETFKEITSAPKAVNALRWWNHIKSFSEAERKGWGATATTAAAKAPAAKKPASDDDFDLFGSDDEDDAAREAEIQRRADEQAAKKAAAGKVLIAKSAVVIDVKPWEDTTDMKLLEEKVRGITMDGLEWKASKLVPVGYGIKKLAISAHIEDDKVSVDDIQEQIQEFEDLVQSTDIQSFTKL